jgi:6-phosphogluconolactonase (cycloisomerase 2 family)
MHGATNGSTTPGPDSLYSQGAIAVSNTANLLAAVNSGSNTVSLFSIDPMTPSTLTALGAPMSSGGEFPISVAFNADGSMLCALNAGQMDGVQ